MIDLCTPISVQDIEGLQVGDLVSLSGCILTGRDAALPKLVQCIKDGQLGEIGLFLEGQVMFHTAVSPAGIGPTSSNKLEIESSIPFLAQAGVRLHLGKGALHAATVQALNASNAIYAVIPPVTALLGSKTLKQRVVAFPELGMEALHELKVIEYPIVIAAAHGESLY